MKNILLILMLAITSTNCQAQKKMKVVYVYDALCGWCYGFSPVINQFQNKYKDSLSFEVVSGGMITGNRIGPIGEVAPYISRAYKDVESATGVTFGDTFLNVTLKQGDAIFSSIPPAIALSVFKSLDANNNGVQFASALQKAIYYDGIEPKNLEEYGRIAAGFALDPADFVAKMQDPVYLKLAEEDFKMTQELQVTGFPSVFIEIEGTYYKIGSGYMSLAQLESRYSSVASSHK